MPGVTAGWPRSSVAWGCLCLAALACTSTDSDPLGASGGISLGGSTAGGGAGSAGESSGPGGSSSTAGTGTNAAGMGTGGSGGSSESTPGETELTTGGTGGNGAGGSATSMAGAMALGNADAGAGDAGGNPPPASADAGGGDPGEEVVFPVPEKPDWTVDSLVALRDAIEEDGQTIVMRAGNYDLSSLPGGSRNLNFSGSNNVVDLVGVYVEVPVGSTDRESYITITGSNNTLVGGIFEDRYTVGPEDVSDFYEYNNDTDDLAYGLRGDAVMEVTGDDNLIDGIKLTVRGSFPYGYGSIYGIGSDNVFGLSKRCGIRIAGEDNTLDHVEVQQRAFCHGIYIQSPADNTTVRNSLVEGVMRLGAELYEETEPDSLPSRTDFELPLDGNVDIPRDVMLPLAEDGIRVYSNGGSVTVENCTVKKMRGGIRLYLASDATVTNSTAIDCGATNFNMPNGGSVSNSSGNFAYAPLSDFRLSRSNQDLELTILPSPHATGPHNLADVLGNNHNLVFHRSPGPIDDQEERAIVVEGNNSTILNETEYRIIVNGDDNDITSAGDVTDNGDDNDVTAIPLEL